MKKLVTLLSVCAFAVAGIALAQNAPETNDGKANVHKFYARGYARPGGGSGQNLLNHGGPVITAPQVVYIFWGFGAAGDAYTLALQNFRNTGIYNYSRMLTQYSNAASSTTSYSLGAVNDKFDSSTPPQNVTDATVQSEVKKYFGGAEDASTIYEVVIPATAYSSDGTGTSCGGPSLSYCAYHGKFADGSRDVKYAIIPYASCSGCQTSGFSDPQNADHFIVHETREATSDPDLNAWYDRQGNEADDKCAWSPTPFIDQTTGFAYQYEWSNAKGGCVKQ